MNPILLLPALALFDQAAVVARWTILALVQGLTEFLPVSSSGHLVLVQGALGMDEPALGLDIALHLGTLLAVVLVYRNALGEILSDALRGRLDEVVLLVVGSVPAAVVGIGLRDRIHEAYGSPRAAAFGLLGTAAILAVGALVQARRGPESAGPAPAPRPAPLGRRLLPALLVGCSQALAILPGISRSGSTIVAGVLLGESPERAARFSFLLSIPAILGAAVLQLPEAIERGEGGGGLAVVWYAAFAGFVGWGALRVLLAFLARGAFRWFSVYCLVLALGVLLFT